jgi:hypothetical protein
MNENPRLSGIVVMMRRWPRPPPWQHPDYPPLAEAAPLLHPSPWRLAIPHFGGVFGVRVTVRKVPGLLSPRPPPTLAEAHLSLESFCGAYVFRRKAGKV